MRSCIFLVRFRGFKSASHLCTSLSSGGGRGSGLGRRLPALLDRDPCPMTLNSEEKELIRNSFQTVSRNSRQAADRFYGILFEMAPPLRELFVNDLERQGAQLMSKLGFIVAEIGDIEGLAPVLEDLALRHLAYGVKPEHYPLVGSALLRMLEECLGDDFTPETRAAWVKTYDELSARMIRSAYAHQRPSAAT